jgi:glycosyltransferase involved in cell wall biosynthesis
MKTDHEEKLFDIFSEISCYDIGFNYLFKETSDVFAIITVFLIFILIIYPYVIYPAILAIMPVRKASIRDRPYDGRLMQNLSVTFLVCVYNGETYIEKKIQNILSLNGFQDNYTVFIVSDCSTDRTDEIVNKCANTSVRLIRCPERYGKTKAENYALQQVSSDIIIFTDASTLFDQNMMIHMLPHYADANVGCVSTCDSVICSSTLQKRGATHEGLYIRYEMLLRKLETKLGVLTGASGSGFSCRRSLAIQIPVHFTRDLHVPLYARELGFKSISEDNAKCLVFTKNEITNEVGRKIRTITNGIDTLFAMKHLLNPFKYGMFAFSLISHKLLRWSSGLLLAFLYLLCLFKSDHLIIGFIFICQTIMYIYCFLRYKGYKVLRCRICNAIYYFIVTNMCSLIAWYNHFRGNTYSVWEPTKR